MNLKSINNLLTNKYVLYATLFFSITNVLGYITLQEFDSLILFILVGFLTSYFSKNMIIILLAAMTTTNVLFTAKKTREFMASMGLQETVVASSKIAKTNITGVELLWAAVNPTSSNASSGSVFKTSISLHSSSETAPCACAPSAARSSLRNVVSEPIVMQY